MKPRERQRLLDEHQPAAVARRLQRLPGGSWVPHAVLGGIDGCVTTFAIVAGTLGAGLPTSTALILGVANLAADGFSMAVSNLESGRAQADYLAAMRRREERHIDTVPEGEREELRQIFRAKGLTGDTLEQIVQTISEDRSRWVDTMLSEELGLEKAEPRPFQSAAVTFIAFVLVGLFPLLPMLATAPGAHEFTLSACLAALMFFRVGALKRSWSLAAAARAGLQTLATGSLAAALAFASGYLLRSLAGG